MLQSVATKFQNIFYPKSTNKTHKADFRLKKYRKYMHLIELSDIPNTISKLMVFVKSSIENNKRICARSLNILYFLNDAVLKGTQEEMNVITGSVRGQSHIAVIKT